MFKHKELQQQLMDTKLQRITEMMKEVEDKQQKERDLVSLPPQPNIIGGVFVDYKGELGCMCHPPSLSRVRVETTVCEG